MKSLTLAALAAAALVAPAAGAATTQITGGTGQRSLTISFFDPVGQIFTADQAGLVSFGFQLRQNNNVAAGPMTLTIRQGEGFGGAIIASRTLTPGGFTVNAQPGWLDFDFTGTTLVAGAKYTASLTTDSNRLGIIFGPDINIFTGQALGGDAYAGGRFIATGQNDAVCNTGICDANFRFTTAAPVPEPATWALMLGGFGLAGAAMRTRKRDVRFA